MEVFVNERKVKVGTEIGRWGSLGGLVVLIAGMVISIRRPELVWATMLSLLVGFLLSVVGAYHMNHWTRTPRADQVLSQELKGISNRYHLYHYLLPASHVMLGPAGLFVFRACLQEGPVSYDGKKWRNKRKLWQRLGFSGQDALGDPIRDVTDEIRILHGWLGKRLADERIPEIFGFVVFVRDDVELNVDETEIPVIEHKQIKAHIRRIDKECKSRLDNDALYAIEQAMLGSKIDDL